ncbi:hypothetical protein BDZ89DRAFT_1162804 [Hymenopellis radicata]|nr:hypothetical protein BDZ89DRAFT_1162804 [Hymenopellis radicata]
MTDASNTDIPNIMSSDSFHSRVIDKPSPYAHLLGTTVSFSTRPEDLALKDELAGFIGVVDGEISACKLKIDGLRAALFAAEQDLVAAKAFRDLHVSIFPPIHTLPPELLTKIFKLVVGCDLTPLRESTRAGPWVLRSVCTYWRHIAESEPRLWRCFDLSLEPGDPTTAETDTQEHRAIDVLLTNTLRWSGSQKLNFAVDLRLFHFPSPDFSANASVTLPPPLKELFANATRWRHATFYNIGRVLSSLPRFGLGDLDGLRTLHLKENWTNDSAAHDYDPTSLEQFANARRLRSLWITVPSSPMVLDNFHWSQLNHLYLDLNIAPAPLARVCYRFFAMSPQLTFYCEGTRNSSGFAGSQSSLISEPTIVLPRLQVLRLSGIDVLFRLQCPQLQQLILPALESNESVDLVVDFLNRSSPQSLERVHVRVALVNQLQAHLTLLLPVIPSVRELVIEAQCSMELVLRVLSHLAAHLQVVPQLQCVDLRLDLRFVILSRPSAVELLQHVSTRAENSKLDHFSLQLYTTAQNDGSGDLPEAPIYDGAPNSPLDEFLSVFRKAHVPELEITIELKLKVLG